MRHCSLESSGQSLSPSRSANEQSFRQKEKDEPQEETAEREGRPLSAGRADAIGFTVQSALEDALFTVRAVSIAPGVIRTPVADPKLVGPKLAGSPASNMMCIHLGVKKGDKFVTDNYEL
jgi:NAD(P)-dependent dehydrogenase (short-subunit alcohol dehydrogenase family)